MQVIFEHAPRAAMSPQPAQDPILVLGSGLDNLSVEQTVLMVQHLLSIIHQKDAEIAALKRRVEELERAGKRQASPFSKGPKPHPHKRPGRRAGEGPFVHRAAPPDSEVTKTQEVSVPAKCPYPGCDGAVVLDRYDDVTITDLPPNPQPIVKKIRIGVGHCAKCGKSVRARHPEVPADQQGATAHRIGPRAMAVAHHLHYKVGVPVRRIPEILKAQHGLKVTQSALTQNALRAAETGPVARRYQKLRQNMRRSRIIHTDDTGFRQGGRSAQLMVFASRRATVFQIRPQHRNIEVREIIPATYSGTMVTDRGKSYDARPLAKVKQQKCNGHILRSIEKVRESKPDGSAAAMLCDELKECIKGAIQLRADHLADGSSLADYKAKGEPFRRSLDELLRPRETGDPDTDRLVRELGRHHRRGSVLRYLDDPSIEPTNNHGEQEIRPAVIARKVSHGTKTDRGSRAHEAFTSHFASARKEHRNDQKYSPVEEMTEMLKPERPDRLSG